MRALKVAGVLVLVVAAGGCGADAGNASQKSQNEAECAGFGFEEGTDGFANCMLQLSLKQGGAEPANHFDQVDQYRQQSMRRMGDDRFPVCSAADMDAELDITTNKWVGPNCQMAPD